MRLYLGEINGPFGYRGMQLFSHSGDLTMRIMKSFLEKYPTLGASVVLVSIVAIIFIVTALLVVAGNALLSHH